MLPPSQTFIFNQAESLRKYTPFYEGSRRVPGLDLPPERTVTLNRWGSIGKPLEAIHRMGFVPPSLARAARAIQPRLLHAHFGPDAVQSLALVKKLHIPLIATFHGHDAVITKDHTSHPLNMHDIYLRRKDELIRGADMVLAVSSFVKSHLLAQGFLDKQVRVHYIGVDTETFAPDPEVDREPIVLFVGRLTEFKGCEFLIRAMSIVQDHFPSIELIVIGDGPLRSALEVQARALLRRYRFLGLQSQLGVRVWMNRAQILCAPSITTSGGESEGFGMVALEAQAVGTPIVGFSSGGLTEAVAHRETGLLVPERDHEALAGSMRFLLSNAGVWNEFSRNARERTVRQFCLRDQTDLLEDLYDELI